jgi:GNAT superfamily N-acetyltransferase
LRDGGRNAARGYLYQYIRTLEELLGSVYNAQVAALYVEGFSDVSEGIPATESIDYELRGHAGQSLLAVQVKARAPSSKLHAAELYRIIEKLVHDHEAVEYQVITNGLLGDSALSVVNALREATGIADLSQRLGFVLSSPSSSRALEALRELGDVHLERMLRTEVIIDKREEVEVRAGLRERLRSFRNSCRAGLGNDSAGLLTGYLIGEILTRAADETRAEFTIEEFKSILMTDGAIIRSSLGRRDWGVIVGSIPAWPDVYRESEIKSIVQYFSTQRNPVGVVKCQLTGMSGIGKSNLAAGYIMDRADLYGAVYWIDAESDAALHSSFTRVLSYLTDINNFDAVDAEALRDRTHDLLARSKDPWLMVFDNCSDPYVIQAWVPKAGNGHVLATTTNAIFPASNSMRLAVDAMTADQALELLRRRFALQGDYPREYEDLLSQLADAMEFWPLALEIAASYLQAGGVGVTGIPNYLATLKIRSLDDPQSIPQGYPRTLIEAIYLCLDRIEQRSQRRDDPADVAATSIWFAAYLSARRIPAHLLLTSVLLSAEHVGGFDTHTPGFVDPAWCPTPEVVSLLRTESLVNIDEPLPLVGIAHPEIPATTVSVNSVLQEILRARMDQIPDLKTEILSRLAYHISIWMSVALDNSDYVRTLLFASHAGSIDQHAVRLGINNDYIAFMRGNLAGVQHRRGHNEAACFLLRTEIDYLQGRAEEHCIWLCCQARVMLAQILALQEPPPAAEITALLGAVYPILQERAPESPAIMKKLALSAQQIIEQALHPHWGFEGQTIFRLSQLESVIADFIERMPKTGLENITRLIEEAESALRREPEKAIELIERALQQIESSDEVDLQTAQRMQRFSIQTLVEALIDVGEYGRAAHEYQTFLSLTEPAEVWVEMRERMLHNAGKSLAVVWLLTDQPTTEMTDSLKVMINSEIINPIKDALAAHDRARMDILQAVRAIADRDEKAGSELLNLAVQNLIPASGGSARDNGWILLSELVSRKIDASSASKWFRTPASSAGKSLPSGIGDLSPALMRAAPELLKGGLPGPRGTWIRMPQPGEVQSVSEILHMAGDELPPWEADAIRSFTLTSILSGVFQSKPLMELAEEVVRGGVGRTLSGHSVVFVAVNDERQVVGAIRSGPPYETISAFTGTTRSEKQRAQIIIAKITGLAVLPDWRGMGIGKRLTRYVSALSWRVGCRLLYGQFDEASGLDKFFVSCGFDVTPRGEGLLLPDVIRGRVRGILPEPGNRFFVRQYDEVPGEHEDGNSRSTGTANPTSE